MKIRPFLLTILLCTLLAGCSSQPEPTVATPLETNAPATVPPETTEPYTGWLEENGRRFFYDGGTPLTGWQEVDGVRYYFRPDGSMATGEEIIDGTVYHFTSQGERVILVNPWNYVPQDYEPDLVSIGEPYGVEGTLVDSSCYDALLSMIKDCNAECPRVYIVSSYRSQEHQTRNYNKKVKYYLNQGYSQKAAEAEAAKIIAVPGTSEHQLGLAVDIVDTRLWSLEMEQENLPAQQWLMENSWKYGFILRYPKDKIDITGIIYEPWHYRYVGKELAEELHELGLTLEEYIHSLTDAVG